MAQSGTDQKHERVIDENIRRVFQETLEEGVPDRFRDLLAQLKEQDAPKGSQK